jgi:membrane-bound serine protease (ClpP class)
MRRLSFIWVLLAALAAFTALRPIHGADAFMLRQEPTPAVVTLRMTGALHPAMLEHFKRSQTIAEREGASLILLELDTPGGSLDLMNSMVQAIRGSDVPVVVYVAPRGAMAASAGTLLTLAGHLSAMAPETTIGAASPVGPGGENIESTMESKYKEMTKATARSLAVNRPPEAIRLAEEMIDTAKAVSVDEALEIGLIDFKAVDSTDLLRQMDGREVQINDQTVALRSAGARMVDVPLTFMEEILMVLANPNIAFLLLAIGVQAILIEISSPGGWVAGFIGVICLLLATYGMGLLPVNWFGLLFLLMAFVLFILDIKAPTHGALTAAGVGSFIAGALVLFNSPNVPSFQRVSVPLVIGSGVAIGLIFFVILGIALRAQGTPQLLRTSIIGMIGTVNTPLDPIGTVQVGSELWTAVAEDESKAVPRGSRVEITGQEHLRIRVKKIGE